MAAAAAVEAAGNESFAATFKRAGAPLVTDADFPTRCAYMATVLLLLGDALN